jgi:hypothetical protein
LMQEQASEDLSRLRQTLNESHRYTTTPTPRLRPTLRDVYEDLRQLRQEFASVTFERGRKGGSDTISVVTEPVELEGIQLGEFRIELRLVRLLDRAEASAFPQDLLDHEGQLEALIGGWLDEYGSKVHPVSFFDPPQQTRQEAKHGGELPPRLCFGEAFDPFDAAMDELYERMEFDEEFERREREVWP